MSGEDLGKVVCDFLGKTRIKVPQAYGYKCRVLENYEQFREAVMWLLALQDIVQFANSPRGMGYVTYVEKMYGNYKNQPYCGDWYTVRDYCYYRISTQHIDWVDEVMQEIRESNTGWIIMRDIVATSCGQSRIYKNELREEHEMFVRWCLSAMEIERVRGPTKNYSNLWP